MTRVRSIALCVLSVFLLLSIAEARDHFADHCAICHGNDGGGRTQINAELYPPAPYIRMTLTQQLSDRALFYTISNGVQFSRDAGVGWWRRRELEADVFIRHLPMVRTREQLTSELFELQSLLIDDWEVPEKTLKPHLFPDYLAPYRGMYFRRDVHKRTDS